MIVLPGLRRWRANAPLSEGAHCANNGLQPPVPQSQGHFREMRAVGFDYKEDGTPLLRLHRGGMTMVTRVPPGRTGAVVEQFGTRVHAEPVSVDPAGEETLPEWW